MENNTSNQDTLDLRAIFTTLWQKRKVFYWVLPITFVLSSALILCVPRYYTCTVVLAPEAQSTGAGGSLSALASSFGFNMNNLASSDAIYPMIYPDVVKSPDFLVHLFDIPVETSDGEFKGTYYAYLHDNTKKPFWSRWIGAIVKWFKPKKDPLTIASDNQDGMNVFSMSEEQWKIIESMQDNIHCACDKKTQIISFGVKAQDPLVCATMANSVCSALQTFIIDYRTQKARADLQYYEEVMNNAYDEYQQASNKYIRYADSHSGMNLEQYRIIAKNLETEMQIKQAAYTSFQKQYLATQARIQENTPVYTVLQSGSIPLKPSGPKRVIFVLGMLFVATIIASCILCKNQLLNLLLSPSNEI